jgi:hypothetical protein
MSAPAFTEVATRFEVISAGGFAQAWMPLRWLSQRGRWKVPARPHGWAGETTLMNHSSCLPSFHQPYAERSASVRRVVERRAATVLRAHGWDDYCGGVPDESFIAVFHEVAAWLASRRDIRAVSVRDVASGAVCLVT